MRANGCLRAMIVVAHSTSAHIPGARATTWFLLRHSGDGERQSSCVRENLTWFGFSEAGTAWRSSSVPLNMACPSIRLYHLMLCASFMAYLSQPGERSRRKEITSSTSCPKQHPAWGSMWYKKFLTPTECISIYRLSSQIYLLLIAEVEDQCFWLWYTNLWKSCRRLSKTNVSIISSHIDLTSHFHS